MNKCIFIGNLTRDPEHSVTGTGVAVCRFTVAVNRSYTNANGERDADFINIVTWRNLADNCSKFLTKGKKVAVVGEMQNRSFDDKDGNKRYVTDIIAENVEFLSSTGNGKADDLTPPPPRGRDKQTESDDGNQPPPPANGNGNPNDGLPF